MITILGLCGSLRLASRNRRALAIAQTLCPPDSRLTLWEGLGVLPPFSPDLDTAGQPLPEPVRAFHEEVDAADALLIACPEYAHGIPGAFKNALDWLVGSPRFPGKPVALLNVAPRAVHAQAQLREVLATMSADIVAAASATAAIPDPEAPADRFEAILREALAELVAHVRRTSASTSPDG